ALNGARNVTFLEGDLFDPIRFSSFDRVVFNSPTNKEGNRYVDLLRAGEGILERFFTKLPEILTPSGYAQVSLAMNDYPVSSFKDRLKSWLGPSADDWQVLLLVCREAAMEDGRRWRRGWLTLRRGSWRFCEVPCAYHRLSPETMPERASDYFRRLLGAFCEGRDEDEGMRMG